MLQDYAKDISIHASAKEATFCAANGLTPLSFQSTPPRRRRLRVDCHNHPVIAISIHASAKEATSKIMRNTMCNRFQSTPPRRRRLFEISGAGIMTVFQSTPPRRRRHISDWTTWDGTSISIHASAKEATATYCNIPAIMCISSLNNFFVRYF